ncbi:alpha/beta hydrolase [Agreia sp. COWG]|uniref:alpha/beta hydrolase n=1 Tax=Agreia sp. COWG TaxID=2773266 RepID=UPI001927EEE3|nr:alpha/beta hydrolase [Agreia sp. COWG]CAD5990248.1 putative Lysophospholipase [Agreia sp. COWG]
MPQFLSDHGVAISYLAWPVESPRGIVQIVHGLGDHAARYAELAARLNASGYSVYAHDQRGHGETARLPGASPRAGERRMGVGGLRSAGDDLVRFSRLLRDEAARDGSPGVPLIVVGHSLGSLILQRVINTRSTAFDGVVFSGTAYRMPGSMDGGDLTRRHRPARRQGTGFEWLTRDVAKQQQAAADELMFEAKALKEFGLKDGLRLFGVPGRSIRHDLPVLIVGGSDDILGGPASMRRLARAYRRRSKLDDVEVVVFPGARHEIFAETNRAEVFDRLVDWLDHHTEP